LRTLLVCKALQFNGMGAWGVREAMPRAPFPRAQRSGWQWEARDAQVVMLSEAKHLSHHSSPLSFLSLRSSDFVDCD